MTLHASLVKFGELSVGKMIVTQLTNHAFPPPSFFLGLSQPALHRLSGDSAAGHWCRLRSRASGPALFQWRPGAIPGLKPMGSPSRCARHPRGAAGLLADDGDAAIGHETQALVARLDAG